MLGRDVNQELIEFWSPTRRPSRAPPSSPKLSPKLIPYNPDHEHQKRSITEFRTLANLDQQLGITSSFTDAHQSQVSDSENPSRRFSFQTQWSSDDKIGATNDIRQSIPQYDDDGVTLVDVSSFMRFSVSEVNTLSGDEPSDAGCDSLESWIKYSSSYQTTFSKPWTSAISIVRSFTNGIEIHPRSNTFTEMQDHRASCFSSFTHRASSSLTRCVSTEQSMIIPLMNNDERSQVSIQRCSLSTHWTLIQ